MQRMQVTLAVLAILALSGAVAAWTDCGSTCCSVCPLSTSTTPARVADEQARSEVPVALEGHCPVCIVKAGKWVKGNPDIRAVYDGRTYLFPEEKARTAFLKNPHEFVPVLGGDCAVCYAKAGKRMPVSIDHSVIHDGRLFVFPSEKEKQAFEADTRAYENVDLALEGHCPVCLTEMNRKMPGKIDVVAQHNGLRYLFPSVKERDMFLADPESFTRIQELRTAE
jgi:YHS domain-containing protein